MSAQMDDGQSNALTRIGRSRSRLLRSRQGEGPTLGAFVRTRV